ncbi:MAG: hypothetical protein M0Q91_03050 [Methanoregula sp.]|jgi:hypothetical protein|nr:hypothetical protein [Methanoregula sp.]
MKDSKILVPLYRMQQAGECYEPVLMHPDDIDAHLAWVMAKRFHEMGLNESSLKNPVNHMIIR